MNQFELRDIKQNKTYILYVIISTYGYILFFQDMENTETLYSKRAEGVLMSLKLSYCPEFKQPQRLVTHTLELTIYKWTVGRIIIIQWMYKVISIWVIDKRPKKIYVENSLVKSE